MDTEARALHAQRLIEDPLLVEALENIRSEAIKVWEGTAAADTAARETAWLTVKVIGRIKVELDNVIANGKIAAARVVRAPIR